MHSLLPLSEYVPSPQLLQSLLSSSEYLPLSHVEHEYEPLLE